MAPSRVLLVATGTIAVWVASAQAQPAPDPFAFFAPVARLSASERQRADAGQAIVHTLAGRDREVAVFATSRINIDADRLIAWVNRIEPLKKSALVPLIQRFSDPPSLADLERMVLPDDDLRVLRRCRPASCGFKLQAAELTWLRPALAGSGPEADARLRQAFREVVLARLRAYMNGGHAALGQWDDDSTTRPLVGDFAALLGRSPYITERLPALAGYLGGSPASRPPGIDAFYYWSQDQVRGRPVMTVTHVAIFRGHAPGEPLALVAGKQIFSTHYMNASLSITALAGTPGGPTYLVYINRTDVDVITGFFGGMTRYLIEGRIRSEGFTAIAELKRRMESGPPPK